MIFVITVKNSYYISDKKKPTQFEHIVRKQHRLGGRIKLIN